MNLEFGPLLETELDAADRVFRIAFGTRAGLKDPMTFDGDAALVRTRYFSKHVVVVGGRLDGELVASTFATTWGSFGFIGPVSVLPDRWNEGLAQRMLEQITVAFDRNGVRQLGLFTFPESPKHLALYRKYGFWPWFLTFLMEKSLDPADGSARHPRFSRFSELTSKEKDRCIEVCRAVTGSLYEGLDLSQEILSVDVQRLGDTILLEGNGSYAGFAICHVGAGTEAGSGNAYVKFAAVHSVPGAGEDFDRLLAACQAFAQERGMRRLVAGVNSGRRDAFSRMLHHGFRSFRQGVAMHRPDEPCYNRPDVYAIDDWR